MLFKLLELSPFIELKNPIPPKFDKGLWNQFIKANNFH